MLHPEKTLAALETKRDRFTEAQEISQEDINALGQALENLAHLSLTEVEARLVNIECPGARPTVEHDQHESAIIPFDEHWSSHQQARAWALAVLESVPTFAVDGSQISPAKDISIPVAVVQVGWFENRHYAAGVYVKNVDVEVLAPNELTEDETEESGFPDWRVNWRRFSLEIDRLIGYMQANADVQPKPLCFFDGSLVVSFAQTMRPDRQALYVDAIRNLLDTSAQTGVFLVGYVDTSYANDLTAMLSHLSDCRLGGRVGDAGLLRSRMDWGDRSQVYICARDDGVIDKYYEHVCFTYLKTTASNSPARIEFPRWIFEAGEHEQVLNLIRAECVVGTGYPYVVETADALAALTMQDRERFYRLFQEFAHHEGLHLRFSRKAVSKRGRRG